VPLAVRALEDPVMAVRIGAIQALGQLADPTTVPALGKMVEDAKVSVAREAAYALSAMNVPQSAELLKSLAAKGDHPARVWIAVALHRIDPTGTDARIKTLMADQDALTRRRTATVLSDLKDYDPTEVLIAALEDADSAVSKAARAFLAQSQSPRAHEALRQFFVARIDKLIPVLSDQDVRARNKAQSDLFELGPDVAPLLMERLLQADDDLVVASLATVVAALRNPQVLPTVVAQLRNAELSDNRRVAFEVFARYFREELGTEALELAKSDAPDLRLSGVRILSSTLDDRAPPVFKAALADKDLRVRVCAAAGLSRLKDAEALAVLKELAKEADRATQQQAIVALGNYDEETALPPILELLAGDDPGVRILAFSTLARFKSPKVTAVIVEKAAADERLQRVAISALGQQGTADAARALSEFLKNDDMTIRRQAEQSLSRIRGPEAQKILQEYRQQQAEQEKAKAEAGKPEKDG
jgi:HEAT repeat protein